MGYNRYCRKENNIFRLSESTRKEGITMETMINTNDRNNLTFTNKKLQNATMQIMQIAGKIKNNWFQIGAIIAEVDQQELYKDDGFENVHAWTMRAFGIKKTTSYDLLRIGKEYTRELLSDKGKVTGYECNLLPENSKANFTTTQVMKMLPAGHEKAQELVDNGVITPDMTTTAISKVIKDLNKKDEEPEEPATDASNEPAEDEAPEAPTHEEWLRMTFDKITTGELIEEMKIRGFTIFDKEGKVM